MRDFEVKRAGYVIQVVEQLDGKYKPLSSNASMAKKRKTTGTVSRDLAQW